MIQYYYLVRYITVLCVRRHRLRAGDIQVTNIRNPVTLTYNYWYATTQLAGCDERVTDLLHRT